MTSPALDLLARAIAEQVSARECEHCSNQLAGARVRVKPVDAGQIGAEIECARCGGRSLVAVGPAGGEGGTAAVEARDGREA